MLIRTAVRIAGICFAVERIPPIGIASIEKSMPARLSPIAGVSGIIEERGDEVEAGLTALGFTVRERRTHGGWCCIVCGKD